MDHEVQVNLFVFVCSPLLYYDGSATNLINLSQGQYVCTQLYMCTSINQAVFRAEVLRC